MGQPIVQKKNELIRYRLQVICPLIVDYCYEFDALYRDSQSPIKETLLDYRHHYLSLALQYDCKVKNYLNVIQLQDERIKIAPTAEKVQQYCEIKEHLLEQLVHYYQSMRENPPAAILCDYADVLRMLRNGKNPQVFYQQALQQDPHCVRAQTALRNLVPVDSTFLNKQRLFAERTVVNRPQESATHLRRKSF